MSAGRELVDANASSENRAKDVPLVSVGLPTFNRATSLQRAMDSVLAQDYHGLELVISDNASSDLTESLCTDYCARDKRVKYTRQPTNRGAFENFLTVLAQSTGKYFMWLGDDDWLGQSYISRCLQVLQSRPDVTLVCGIAKYYESDTLTFEGVKVDLTQASPSERVLAYYRQVNDNGTFYGLARRETLINNPIRNDLGGDWLLIARLALAGKILTLDDVAICRSSCGESADVRSLALSHGMSPRKARHPHRTIAINVARDIVRQSPSVAHLNMIARLVLAGRSGLIVHRRFVEMENPLGVLASKVGARLKRSFQHS